MKTFTTEIRKKLYFICNFAELGLFRVQSFQEIVVLLLKMVLHGNLSFRLGKNCILFGINLNSVFLG